MAKKKSELEDVTPEGMQQIMDDIKIDPIHNLKYKTVYVHPIDSTNPIPEDNFMIDWKLQPREVTDGLALVDNIRSRGLETPPTSWIPEGAKIPQLLTGHRRNHALHIIIDKFNDDYERLFPNGFPMKVYLNLTLEQAMVIRDDHDMDDLKQRLESCVEVFNLVAVKFDLGWSERKIVANDWRTIARVMGSGKTYGELVTETASMTNDRDKLDRIFTSQRGNIQNLHQLFNGPDVLLAFWKGAIRGQHIGFAQKSHYTKLVQIFLKEQQETLLDPKAPRVSKKKPGPVFTQAFADFKKEHLKGASTDDSKPKALKTAEREDLAKSLNSKGLAQAVLASGGHNQCIAYIKTIDGMLAMIETAYAIEKRLIDLVVQFYNIKNATITDGDFNKIKILLDDYPIAKKEEEKTAHPNKKAKTKTKVSAS